MIPGSRRGNVIGISFGVRLSAGPRISLCCTALCSNRRSPRSPGPHWEIATYDRTSRPLRVPAAGRRAGAGRTGRCADEAKVLRLALSDIAYLDPQQITDLYSTRVANVIFEGLYQFDYLATPARVVPNTAVAMPEISDNGRTWTIRIQPGILFASAPAFKGKPRELVAQDYVYSITRLLDPNLKRGGDPAFTNLLEGARPVIDAAKKSGKLDYDAKIEGLQAIDRHTLRLKLTSVDYTILERLAQLSTFAVAREVVEAAGDDRREQARGHGTVPVGRVGTRVARGPRGQSRLSDHSRFPAATIRRCSR